MPKAALHLEAIRKHQKDNLDEFRFTALTTADALELATQPLV